MIYLLIYTHKHGADYSVHRSQKGAQHAAEEIAAEYREDYAPGSMKSNADLVSEWWELTDGDEDLGIERLAIQP